MPWPPLSCWAARRTTAVPPVTSLVPVTRVQAALLTGGRSPCLRGEALQNGPLTVYLLFVLGFFWTLKCHLITQSSHHFICSSFHTAFIDKMALIAKRWQRMHVYVYIIDLHTTGTLLSQRSGKWRQREEAVASQPPAGPEWRTALTDHHQVRPHSISDELLKGRVLNARCLKVRVGGSTAGMSEWAQQSY